jgi:hypothetical protein
VRHAAHFAAINAAYIRSGSLLAVDLQDDKTRFNNDNKLR